MCAEGPPSYSELETNNRCRLRKEAALAQVSQDATYCVHYRLEHHGINLDDHPDYRRYQTFYELGIAPPTHQEMADIVIQAIATSTAQD